eukprot:g381.t1
MGATVILGCRSVKKCEEAKSRIAHDMVAEADSTVAISSTDLQNLDTLVPLDLSSFASINKFADNFLSKYNRLDILFANAGFATAPSNGKHLTSEGFELGLGVMHFGHFLLYKRLETILDTTSNNGQDVRVVVTSSAASQAPDIFKGMGANFDPSIYNSPPGDLRGEITKTTNGARMYPRSKLANVLFARQLQMLKPNLTTCSCHVGAVATAIWHGRTGKKPREDENSSWREDENSSWREDENSSLSKVLSKFTHNLISFYTQTVMRDIEQGQRIILKCGLSKDDTILFKGAYLDGMGK